MHKCEFSVGTRACGILGVEMTAQYTRMREIARYGVKMRVRCDAPRRGKNLLPAKLATCGIGDSSMFGGDRKRKTPPDGKNGQVRLATMYGGPA